jgi:hypothetical protein
MTPKKRGPKPGTGGRPKGSGKLGKVKLTCLVKPETREKLGELPGATLDLWAKTRKKP